MKYSQQSTPLIESLLKMNYKSLWSCHFRISFLALTQSFTFLECVHLDTDTAKDESSLADRPKRWQMKMYQGQWRRGVTAGGCRNHDSFHINPQLQLTIQEKEDVIIALNQHTAIEPKVIGFTMYKLSTGKKWVPLESNPVTSMFSISVKNKVSECLPKEFFKSQVSYINSDYGNTRHVSHRCVLDVGRYLLMATTYEPGEESSFTVRILGNNIRLSQLETQTMMLLDPFPPLSMNNESDSSKAKKCQYEPVFMQLADENKYASQNVVWNVGWKLIPKFIPGQLTVSNCKKC